MRVKSAAHVLASPDGELLGGQVFGPDAIGDQELVVLFADEVKVGHVGPWLI